MQSHLSRGISSSTKVFMPLSRAFTLIELLAVITVVVVLAALLVPVVQNARSSAGKAECASRLRQWGQAMGNYSAENSNRLNFGFGDTYQTPSGSSTTDDHWALIYVDYFSGGMQAERFNRDPGMKNGQKEYWVQYGINAQLKMACGPGGKSGSFVNSLRPQILRSALKSTGYVMTDCVVGAGQGGLYGYSEDPRHGKKGNFLFADGHVETLAPPIGEYKVGSVRDIVGQ